MIHIFYNEKSYIYINIYIHIKVFDIYLLLKVLKQKVIVLVRHNHTIENMFIAK